MRIRTALAAAALFGVSLPALAAADVPADADIALWCGQAFALVAVEIKAEDAGASEELATRAVALLAEAATLLTAAGFSEADATTAADSYKASVATEIADQGENAKYSYDECIALAE